MKVLVIGASLKPIRYSNRAVNLLRSKGHDVVAIGRRKGTIADVSIETEQVHFQDIHTVSLYLNPENQEDFRDYIISLHPKRVIFNPGTENPEFQRQLENSGIEVEVACTLVLLRLNSF